MTAKAVQGEADRPYVAPALDTKPEPEDDGWGKDGLTLKQRRFVKAYVGPAAGNATKAAEMAGYNASNRNSLKVTACNLLTFPNVQRSLALALAKHRGGKEWTRRSLVDIARTSMADFIQIDGQGRGRIDFAKAEQAAAIGAIKKLKADPEGNVIALELYDRKSALDTLAKMHGTLSERIEHTGPNGGPIQSETKHSVDYDAIEAELRSIAGGRMAGRASPNN